MQYAVLLARRSLSTERKCYWNTPVAYPICQNVYLESVLVLRLDPTPSVCANFLAIH